MARQPYGVAQRLATDLAGRLVVDHGHREPRDRHSRRSPGTRPSSLGDGRGHGRRRPARPAPAQPRRRDARGDRRCGRAVLLPAAAPTPEPSWACAPPGRRTCSGLLDQAPELSAARVEPIQTPVGGLVGVRVYHAVTDPAGEWTLGLDHACEIEFWRGRAINWSARGPTRAAPACPPRIPPWSRRPGCSAITCRSRPRRRGYARGPPSRGSRWTGSPSPSTPSTPGSTGTTRAGRNG